MDTKKQAQPASAQSSEAQGTQFTNLLECVVHSCGEKIDFLTKQRAKSEDGTELYTVYVRQEVNKVIANKQVTTVDYIALTSILPVPEGLRMLEVKITSYQPEGERNANTYYRILKVRN